MLRQRLDNFASSFFWKLSLALFVWGNVMAIRGEMGSQQPSSLDFLVPKFYFLAIFQTILESFR